MSARGSGRFSLSPCAGRRKMPQPKPGRAAAAAVDEGSAGGGGGGGRGEGGDKREPARPRMNGENIFTCQAKIYSYVNTSKISTSRSPLQQENSTTHPEIKGQPCKLETCQKLEDRVQVGDSTASVAKSDSQNSKAVECESSASPSSPNPEPTEPRKVPPAKSNEVPTQKQAPNKGGKKPASRRKGQGKTPPNRKVTDYYPVRRSSRKNKKELQTEEKKRIDELIKSGKEDGMKIDFIDGKGRGVIATRHFNRGEFVVEYHGDLIEIMDAKKREAAYAQDPSTGCYMYYFQYLSKTFCVDATKETNRLGRLVNHSKCGNCQTKLHDISGVPHLILVASRDIRAGEELLYDYGDRSKASLEAHPWLKH
ncbi:N-lysine methyltransferase KMT5A isoform X1 [Notechis scutatus]|uniref:[histone H4]-lysine(20) N-methyltransferase n=1 Tax=Notechis scutatus TaxID=8663 RepID=A0A6J1VS68_9SAUR|nr:N-lysine methyltransferase KMT5A isoform X1 [Notechis scutatus]XP_026542794.1 N-lysine methyltransferase KMT5A isoform X1 [Notechis scutatus]